MNIDTADDGRANGCHRKEAMLPSAIVSGSFIQTEQIL
jgi:hypothetical protein